MKWVFIISKFANCSSQIEQVWIIVTRFPRVKVSIVGSLCDREVACSASDRQGSNFESCVWRTVSSQSSHHPQEVLLAQFSLYVHKSGLKPDSFHFCHPLQVVGRGSETQLQNGWKSKLKDFTINFISHI